MAQTNLTTSQTMKPVLGISLFAVFSTIVLLLSTFAASDVTFSLSSSASTVATGDTISVDLNLKNNGNDVLGFDTYVSYDPAQLQYVSASKPSGDKVFASQASLVSPGTINILAATATETPYNADTVLSTIVFTVLADSGNIAVELSGSEVGGPDGVQYSVGSEPASFKFVETGGTDGGGNSGGNDGSVDTVAPSVVTGVTLVTSASDVRLAWQAGADNVGVTGYNVYRKKSTEPTSVKLTSAPVTTTNYIDSTVVADESLEYTVTALDAASNESTASAPVSATIPSTGGDVGAGGGNDGTGDGTTPPAPTSDVVFGLSASPATPVAGQNVTVSVSLDNQGKAVLGYQTTINYDPAQLEFVSADKPTGDNIFAADASLDSPGQVTILAAADPSTPFTATQAAGSVVFKVLASSGDVSVSTSNSLVGGENSTTYSAGDGTSVLAVSGGGSDTSGTDAGGTDAGGSDGGGDDGSTPADTTAPSTVSGVSATANGSSSVTVSWSAATDNVGVSSYEVSRRDTGSFASAGRTNGSTTRFESTGLAESTTYEYRVVAIDAAGNRSQASTVASVTTSSESTTPPVGGDVDFVVSSAQTTVKSGDKVSVSVEINPGAAQVVGFEGDVTYDSAKLRFESATKPAGVLASDAKSTTPGKVSLLAATDPSSPYTSKTLVSRVEFTVLATSGATDVSMDSLLVGVSGGEVSASANTKTFKISTPSGGDTTKPTAPKTLRAAAPSTSLVQLSWSPSQDTSSIEKYVISRRRQGAPKFDDSITKRTQNGDRTQWDDRTVFSGITYEYRVRGIDSAGNISGFSNIATIKVPARQSSTPAPAPASPSPSSGGSPVSTDDPITEDDVQAVEDPAEVFGTTGDGEPSEELIGQTFTGAVNYKSANVDVSFSDIKRAFLQYGLFEEGLFNRTEEVNFDGNGNLNLELPELTPGTRYFYQVVAENAAGNELLGEVQEVNTLGYTVTATITDAEGTPLPLLAVTLFSDPIQAQTDENGVATFDNVSPGQHTIDFNYQGEQISQPITVEDTIVADDGTPPEAQLYTVTATTVGAALAQATPSEGGSGLVAFIVVLLVLVAIAVAVYIFIRRQQQPYGTPSYDSNVITPGPGNQPPQDMNSVAGQSQQYPAPGSVYDPNQK